MKLRFNTYLAAVLLVSAAALAQNVNVDWDHKITDFSKYKTYSWLKPVHPTPNPLMDQRIVEDVDSQLAAKGMQKVDQNADMQVTYQAGLRQEKSATVYGMGGGWRLGGGMGQIQQNIENVGTLVVDLVDAKENQLVWRGVASDALSDKSEKNAKKLQKAIEKMFKKYPPNGTKPAKAAAPAPY